MTQSKKYSCHVSQDGTTWTAEIVRRVSSKKTHTTKKQSGFVSEAEAQAWGESEVKTLLNNLNKSESEKRRAKKAELEQKAAQQKTDHD